MLISQWLADEHVPVLPPTPHSAPLSPPPTLHPLIHRRSRTMSCSWYSDGDNSPLSPALSGLSVFYSPLPDSPGHRAPAHALGLGQNGRARGLPTRAASWRENKETPKVSCVAVHMPTHTCAPMSSVGSPYVHPHPRVICHVPYDTYGTWQITHMTHVAHMA